MLSCALDVHLRALDYPEDYIQVQYPDLICWYDCGNIFLMTSVCDNMTAIVIWQLHFWFWRFGVRYMLPKAITQHGHIHTVWVHWSRSLAPSGLDQRHNYSSSLTLQFPGVGGGGCFRGWRAAPPLQSLRNCTKSVHFGACKDNFSQPAPPPTLQDPRSKWFWTCQCFGGNL